MRAIAVAALAVLAMLYAGVPTFQPGPTAATGVSIRQTGPLIGPNVITVEAPSPGYAAGLRSGDIVACLTPRTATMLSSDGDVVLGDMELVRGCVVKGKVRREFAFAPDPRWNKPTYYGPWPLGVLRLLEFSVFLLAGGALVMARPGPMAWTFFAYCLAAAPASPFLARATRLPEGLYTTASAVGLAVVCAAYGLLLIFALIVPQDRAPRGWRLWACRFAWVWTAGCAAAGLSSTASDVNISPLIALMQIASAALVTIVTAARLATMESQERARFGWAAFAIIWAVFIDLARTSLPSYFPGLGIVPAFLSVISPLAMIYAILRKHVIDVRFVMSRTVVYAMLTAVLVGGIGLVDWGTGAFLHHAQLALALDAAVTVALAFALNHFHKWLEEGVEFLLFRKKFDSEIYLQRLARTLAAANEEETVDRALVRAPEERLDLVFAALFRNSEDGYVAAATAGSARSAFALTADHELVRFLLTERARVLLSDLPSDPETVDFGAGLAIPIFHGAVLSGFVIYGTHRDGTRLDPDEIATLERLVAEAAAAYTLIENRRYRQLLAVAATPA